jgi:hypothetical protein
MKQAWGRGGRSAVESTGAGYAIGQLAIFEVIAHRIILGAVLPIE